MLNFGYFSPSLQPREWWGRLSTKFPEAVRYHFGPLQTGTLIGKISGAEVQGWGWQVPKDTDVIWNRSKEEQIWRRINTDFTKKQVKVLGIDPGSNLNPPEEFLTQPGFPGVSDGKSLEALLFIYRFRAVFRSRGIATQNAKVAIVWEEGNLGLTCARLIAGDIRFLTLIHPNYRILEQAAEIIYSESGISPIISTRLTEDVGAVNIIIQCGKISRDSSVMSNLAAIKFKLFQGYPIKSQPGLHLPLEMIGLSGPMQLSPVLGETLLRAGFDVATGSWIGSNLIVERIAMLAKLLNEIGVRIKI
ncbi:MAG TPA: hypothetical protein PLZ08_02085 [Bacillota bacterium]|nr:hypothetical protein [Bacillota bacterium]HOL09054.1 hypothetical protein [Bacillota bacterium]HPO96729.1 hypothetical protein [Bacillota bacterium]